MQKIIISLLTYLCFSSLVTGADVENDFQYEPTVNESMSKYYRINNIEKYLSNIQSKISSLKSDLKTEDEEIKKDLSKQLESIKKEVGKLAKEVNTISSKEIPLLKKAIESGGDLELKENVKKNTEAIEGLNKRFSSMELMLKSMNEMMKTKRELDKFSK